MRLPRGSVISGHVFDENSEPMPGTMVRVMMYRYAQGSRQLVPAGNGQTDDRGRVPHLGPESRRVPTSARSTGTRTSTSISADRAAAAAGPFGPAGRGLGLRQGSKPRWRREVSRSVATPTQDDPADFAYAPTYYPGVSSPNEARAVTVGLSAEVLGIDFNVLLVRTGRISGRVNNADGTPAGSGNVNLVADVSGGRGAALGGGYGSRIQDGAFAIANVPPGRYILRATGDGGRGRGRGGRGGDATASRSTPRSR